MCLDCDDCQVWNSDSMFGFSVSTLYSHNSSLLGPQLKVCKCVWNSLLPPRVSFSFFGWPGKIRSNVLIFCLRLVSWTAMFNPPCHFCSSELESSSHALLHCPFSWSILSAIVEEWGLYWCIPKSVDGLLFWWMSGKFHKFDRLIWRAIPLIVLWSI